MNKSKHYAQKLLVEGNDDLHVVWALCEKFKVPQTFEVLDMKGVESLLIQLPIRLKESDVETIGLIIDADVHLSNRWKSVGKILKKAGFSTPTKFPKEGLILTSTSDIKIGVWIMPNNKTKGILEDFIAFLVPKRDELLPAVDLFLGKIESKKIHQYKAKDKAKARIHTWLALQSDPGTPLGQSITKKYLSVEEETCKRFIGWLNALFNP